MASETSRPSALFMLKWPLLLLVLSLLAGGALLSAAYLYLQSEQKLNLASQRMMGDASSRMSNANRELDDLKNSIDKFSQLKARGAFSPENRMNWIEQMIRLQRQGEVAQLNFDLGAQKKPVLQGNKSFGALDVMASPVKLNFRALHEGEALNFIEALNRSAMGMFPVESCLFSRIGPDSLSDPQPRLEVECRALWVTLSDKRQPAPVPVQAPGR